VKAINFSGVFLGLGKMWVKEEQNGRIYKNLSIDPFLHKILSFLSGCKPTWHTLLILGSYLEVNMFLKLNQMIFFALLHMVEGWLAAHNGPIKH
jgi:hypothetical protein